MVAGGPRVPKQRAGLLLERPVGRVPCDLEGGPQRGSPSLVPPGAPAGRATAVAHPPADSVRAGPRAAFAGHDPSLGSGRIAGQIRRVVRDRELVARRKHCERVSEPQLAELVVMSVSLSVGGGVDEMAGTRVTAGKQTQEVLGRGGRPLESDRSRYLRI